MKTPQRCRGNHEPKTSNCACTSNLNIYGDVGGGLTKHADCGNTVCGGRIGGVLHGAVLKSRKPVFGSSMPTWAASRAVNDCSLKRVSISLMIAVKSLTSCETKFFFAYGETTTSGTRYPV